MGDNFDLSCLNKRERLFGIVLITMLMVAPLVTEE